MMRPTTAESSSSGRSVTRSSVTSGVPSAPKATGAVLAMSESPAACSGENPSPINIAPVTATGVPNPAAPSKNAPKQNAISSSCRRLSSVMPAMESRSTANCPRSSVSWYMKMMLRTIQPMGSRP